MSRTHSIGVYVEAKKMHQSLLDGWAEYVSHSQLQKQLSSFDDRPWLAPKAIGQHRFTQQMSSSRSIFCSQVQRT